MRTVRLVTALLTLATNPALAQQDTNTVALTDADKIYGLSLLWQETNYNFVYFDKVPHLNWDSVYRATLPRVLQTTSTYDYYRELQRFLALLGDGHTGVYMPANLQAELNRRDTYPWVLTTEVDGRILVRAVGASLADRVPVYSEVVAIEGRPALEVAMERHAPYAEASTAYIRQLVAITRALNGPVNQTVRVGLVTPTGERREVVLNRDRRTREDTWQPDINAQEPMFEFRWLPGEVAYVAINTMNDTMPARNFEDSLPALRRAKGVIIDLRRNGGGSSSVGWRIASWLTNDSLVTSRWRTREHRGAFKAWRRDGYATMNAWHDGGEPNRISPADGDRVIVPTVVLQDYQTGSAAEDFLIAVDKVPHITLVGRRSNGSTGQPLQVQLPGGGGARIVSKRDTYPDGREFVGVGVIPDIEVARTVTDVRNGTDSQLARAIALLRERIGR